MNTSFDLTSSVNNKLNQNDQNEKDSINQFYSDNDYNQTDNSININLNDNFIKATNQELNNSHQINLKKKKSLTNLIKNKFKRKSNSKLKIKEPKSMVRSISIAFTSNEEFNNTSQKTINKSISNLYLNQNDNRSSLNDDTRSTNERKKKSKLKKLSDKLKIKFKFRNNSLDDRSTTDLDDSLEQQESDVFDRSDDNENNLIKKLNFNKFDQVDYSLPNKNQITNNQQQQLKNEYSDSYLLNDNKEKINLKLRPKSEIYLGDNNQFNNLKSHRFTTIEVMENFFNKLFFN